MEEIFDKEKIKKMSIEEFIEMRINSLQGLLNLNLPYEKDCVFSAILDEYLMMKTFIIYKEG